MNKKYNDAIEFHGCDAPEPIFVDENDALKVREFSNRFSRRPNGTKSKITGIKSVSKFLKDNLLKFHKVYTISNNGKKILISPEQIKVVSHDNSGYDGITSVVYGTEDSPIFETISIYKSHNNKTSFDSVYIHELVHTQMESVQGSYSNVYNSELISILLELIYSYWYRAEDDEQLINYQIKNFSELLSSYAWKLNSNNKDLATSIYYNSIIKAIYLFSEFKISNKKGKKTLIANIQAIFDGKITVEDFLCMYGVPELEDICNDLSSIACRV